MRRVSLVFEIHVQSIAYEDCSSASYEETLQDKKGPQWQVQVPG